MGLSDEKIFCRNIFSNIVPGQRKIYLTFNSDILAQEKVVYSHGPIVNIYVVYTILYWPNSNTDVMKNCLFGATAFDDKKWSGYGLAFGIKDYLHKTCGKTARNLIILGADTSDDDKATENSIVTLGKGSVSITRTETVEAKEEIETNCTKSNEKLVLSLHYDASDDNSKGFLFVNNTQQYEFEANKDEIKSRQLCLGGFLNDPSKIYYALGNGWIYHFSVDYQPVATNKVQKIHKYLLKEHNIK